MAKSIEGDAEAIRNTLNIGERLLCQAKDSEIEQDGRSRFLRDGVILECLRGHPNEQGKHLTRVAHGCILQLSSDYFAEQLREHEVNEDKKGSLPTLKVDVSTEILDLILEYVYTNETITVPPWQALQLLVASKKLRVHLLVDEMSKYFVRNLHVCVKEPSFLDYATDLAEDVQHLEEVFTEMKFSEALAQKLVQRIVDWGSRDAENKVVAFTLIEKISTRTVDEPSEKTLRTDRPCLNETEQEKSPSAPPHHFDECDNCEKFSPPPESSIAVVVKQPDDRAINCLAYAILQDSRGVRRLHQITYRSLTPVKCGAILSELPVMADQVILRRGEILTLEDGRLASYDFMTGNKLRKIRPPVNELINGITTFEEDVYAWTNNEVFLVTQKAGVGLESLTKVGASPRGIPYCLRVLKRSENDYIEFAHPNSAWTCLHSITCSSGKFVSSDDIFKWPRGIYVRPFGAFQGTNYVLLFNAFYRELALVEVREGAEHKRIPITRFCDWFSCRHIQCGSRGYVTFKTVNGHIAGSGACGLVVVDLIAKTATSITLECIGGLDKVILMPVI